MLAPRGTEPADQLRHSGYPARFGRDGLAHQCCGNGNIAVTEVYDSTISRIID